MKRGLLVLAALIYVSPVPRQAFQSSAQARNNGQNQGNRNGQPAAPSASVNSPIKPGAADSHSRDIGQQNKEQKIAVVSIPTISVVQPVPKRWDGILTWGPWLFNLGLVIVGTLQVWLLLRTRDEVQRQADWIEKQAGYMKDQTEILRDSVESAKTSAEASQTSADAAQKSADAALAQINAMKSRDRAKITFELDPFRPHLYFKTMQWGQQVNWRVRLHGQSEAYKVQAPAIMCIGEPEKHPFFGLLSLQLPENLSPVQQREYSGQVTLHFQNGSGENLGDGDAIREKLEKGEMTLFYAGSIEYTDVYGDRWTLKVRKRWVYLKNRNETLERVSGSPGGFWYNDGENGEKKKES